MVTQQYIYSDYGNAEDSTRPQERSIRHIIGMILDRIPWADSAFTNGKTNLTLNARQAARVERFEFEGTADEIKLLAKLFSIGSNLYKLSREDQHSRLLDELTDNDEPLGDLRIVERHKGRYDQAVREGFPRGKPSWKVMAVLMTFGLQPDWKIVARWNDNDNARLYDLMDLISIAQTDGKPFEEVEREYAEAL